jgi:hypothetical protein
MGCEKNTQGFVLTAVLMMLLIATLVGGAFLFSARNSFAAVDRWKARDECLLGLQSGLEEREYAVHRWITNNAVSTNMYNVLANLNVTATNYWTNSEASSAYVVTTRIITTSGSVQVVLSNMTASITLTNIATATHKGITRRVRETIEYTYGPAPIVGGSDGSVFDNIFFIDNIGLFSGVNADFNGDVYANKDLDLQYSSLKVNGDRYSGGDILSKQTYKNDSWSSYGSQANANRVRPAENTDYNRSNTNTYWPQGYDSNVASYELATKKEMPFIGPLIEYQNYATASGGTVRDSTRTNTIYAVWGDDAGENAGNTNDTGCLILVGTSANPIVISNIVVATKDIYIKGYYTGQGTLYAGRNIYIIGDLIAQNPPTWPHPDNNPAATATANKTRDFLGLCAKGSMAFGRPTELNVSFLRSPYTGSHATDVSDAALGYVSYYSDGVPYFDGDYTQPDGNGAEKRSDGSVRHFYDPIISTATLEALGVSSRIEWIDGVLYANHLIAGDFQNATLNGAFICRDESVTRYGNLALNWDIRIGSRSQDSQYFSPWLPGMLTGQAAPARKVRWTELVP